ncbi:hypothetical protein E1293_36920 [Actinomadura darangshiensis]|uniref:Sulfotransferase family protein n=1 Tax=Actinomadura darangshiensis TaxID=705336 RepID=A0A4R5AB36_9ACTN|nr:hypothetical protein [Actinomadura darangshiensis]TDD68430.1 hypothetical protein E1293_36920 [Actinomadura darangshiensis]
MPVVSGGSPPTVYLHIGAPKSGTTFLQGLLWSNAQALSEAGVLLPGGSFGGQVQATRDLRQVEPEPDEPGPSWDGAWDGLADQIKESGHRVAVLSHEVLCAADAAAAGRAVASLAPCEVHVVYSARDLAGLLPSEWQEYVKHRYHFDFEHWLREVVDGPRDGGAAGWFWQVHDIPEVLGRWVPHVPPERVHVLTMPGPDAPRERLWERFAGLLGIDPAVADLTEARANTSLSWTETELLRRVNSAVDMDAPMWLYHRLVTEVLALKVLPGRGEDGRVPLPPERLAWADEKARELVESVRSAGYDVVGDLDELLPAGARQGESAASPEDAELLDAAAHTILGLLDRIAMLRGEIGTLRQERREQHRTALPKLMARHLSERNEAVWKMRVGYWHLVERLKGIEPTPGPEKETETETDSAPDDDEAGEAGTVLSRRARAR